MLMDEMGKLYIRIADSEQRLKSELTEIIDQSIRNSESRMTDNFSLIAENLRYDMIGTHKDKISMLEDRTNNHERRITQLERTR